MITTCIIIYVLISIIVGMIHRYLHIGSEQESIINEYLQEAFFTGALSLIFPIVLVYLLITRVPEKMHEYFSNKKNNE